MACATERQQLAPLQGLEWVGGVVVMLFRHRSQLFIDEPIEPDSMFSNGLATSGDLLDIETMEKRHYPVDTLQCIRFLSVSAEFGE